MRVRQRMMLANCAVGKPGRGDRAAHFRAARSRELVCNPGKASSVALVNTVLRQEDDDVNCSPPVFYQT